MHLKIQRHKIPALLRRSGDRHELDLVDAVWLLTWLDIDKLKWQSTLLTGAGRRRLAGLEGYLIPTPSSCSLLLFSWYVFPATNVQPPYTDPKAGEPSNHRLKALNLWADDTVFLFFFFSYVSQVFCCRDRPLASACHMDLGLFAITKWRIFGEEKTAFPGSLLPGRAFYCMLLVHLILTMTPTSGYPYSSHFFCKNELRH